ncbi:MAG: rRNA pseudouridine synthase [Verrucomicrobiales bacterium]|nr:rRNA pseudouridine synthase [Verrucomicrobiales bacterium]
MRLNKYLASCGVDSRRKCEALIKEGRVEINGRVVTELATQVEPDDHVKFDGRLLQQKKELSLILNKPKSYLCTRDDPEGRKTVYDLLPNKFHSLHNVGRLDYDSCGLLIMTNSGDLTELLTHPRYHVEKEYEVVLDRAFDRDETKKLLKGIHISEGLAKAERVEFESRKRCNVVLTQGYNRQIRRMFSRLGYKVKFLERIRIGGLTVPGLNQGDFRPLNGKEIRLATEGKI